MRNRDVSPEGKSREAVKKSDGTDGYYPCFVVGLANFTSEAFQYLTACRIAG